MVTVDALVSPAECLAAFQDAAAWAKNIYMAYAWATSSGGTAEHWRSLPLAKVRQAVLGLDFDETEPEVLRQLRALGVLRIVTKLHGVFHPKILVAVNGSDARALVGSSNFTVGGFAKNVEVNVLVSGLVHDQALQKVLTFVESSWMQLGVELDDATLTAYEQRYASRPAPRDAGV
jgi:phosphatidylserine/phosphatidylglycerophosphate/cardiolipin synthase-like enzyme